MIRTRLEFVFPPRLSVCLFTEAGEGGPDQPYLEPLLDAGLDPVLVGEEDGLRRALLARVGVGVLVGGPRHVVKLLHVGAQHLIDDAFIHWV